MPDSGAGAFPGGFPSGFPMPGGQSDQAGQGENGAVGQGGEGGSGGNKSTMAMLERMMVRSDTCPPAALSNQGSATLSAACNQQSRAQLQTP